MDEGAVKEGVGGYVIDGEGTIESVSEFGPTGNIRVRVREVVPIKEAQPSPDGRYWRCQKPDGSRRCFFAPPGSV